MPRGLKAYILKAISGVQEKLELQSQSEDSEEEENIEIKVPPQFNKTLNTAFTQLKELNHINISTKEEQEIIENLYLLYNQIKTKNFDNTDYSQLFFHKIKEIIINCDIIQNEILKLEMDNFFENADALFNRNIENEKAAKQTEKDNIQKQYDFFKNTVIPEIKDYLDEKEKKIQNIIIETKKKCLNLIENEIEYAEERLNDADKDLEKATSILEEKIKTEFNEMVRIQEEESKTIIPEIIKRSKKAIETHYNKDDLSESDVDVKKEKVLGIVTTLLSGALGGVATGVGLAVLGSSVVAGVAAGTVTATAMTTLVGSFFGPLGIVAGLGVGGLITGIGFLVRVFTRTKKYKKALEQTKSNIREKFDDIESSFLSKFGSFKNSLIEELKVKNEVYYKGIDHILIPNWNQMIKEYNERKTDIKAKLRSKISAF